MLTAALIIAGIIAYCIGNFNSATTLSRLVFKKDIREMGSGSAGATNMYRIFGARWGFLTLFIDAFKGYLAYWIGYGTGYMMTNGEYALTTAAVAGVLVVVGHNWPVFYRFKGGKGVASSLGVVIAVSPAIGLAGFAIAVLAVLLTNYMSIGSMAGMLLAFILGLILKPAPIKLMLLALLLLEITQHRSNIQRLINGVENPMMSQSLLDKIRGRN